MFLGLLIKIFCEFMGNPKHASILTYQASKNVKESQTNFVLIKGAHQENLKENTPLSCIGKAGMVNFN
ncbi:MAG: hypothetical protein BRC33_02745 [Cyanobacteria bacterium SW_9_44_58]|nr:MAG: hypothetical protein BRC33_02745 [Cyanobacteria bacterium SW_9_44_58]